jgi:hypothetical protein
VGIPPRDENLVVIEVHSKRVFSIEFELMSGATVLNI